MMADTVNQQTLLVAADWWLRLRSPDASEQTVAQWLAWTDEDAGHLAAFEKITALGERLSALGEVSRAQLVAEFAPVATASRHRWLPLAAAASVVAVALLGGYMAWSGTGGRATPQIYSSAVAAKRDVSLADGSTVTLGGATQLTTRFSRGQREVELASGEAFFQVAHQAQRPFVVNAGRLAIHDIGTAFDVRRTGDQVTVVVTEGRVRIFDKNDAGGQGLEAVAGQRVTYEPGHAALSVSSTDAERAVAWRNDRLEFDNEPLAIVVANINRYSDQPIRIADANLAPLTFTGTVKTDAIDDWLRALPQVLPLKVTEISGQRVLVDERHAVNR